MENPLEWNEVQKTIHESVAQCDKDQCDGIVGHSYVMYIYNALKKKGYLKDEY
jgi:hypothetical protein